LSHLRVEIKSLAILVESLIDSTCLFVMFSSTKEGFDHLVSALDVVLLESGKLKALFKLVNGELEWSGRV